jgi:pentatricopeptide repeat protein
VLLFDAVVGAALEACAVAGEYAKGLDLFDKLMQERNTGYTI